MKKAVLEGLLFVVGEEGLTLEQIEDVLQIEEEEAKKLLYELKTSITLLLKFSVRNSPVL